MAVSPHHSNAEPVIVITASGRVRLVRRGQHSKRRSEILVRCDGASNVTVDNLEHHEKTENPRVVTEAGTVNEANREQPVNADVPIL
jgi:hypothetical protein